MPARSSFVPRIYGVCNTAFTCPSGMPPRPPPSEIDWFPEGHVLYTLNKFKPNGSTEAQYNKIVNNWGRKWADQTDMPLVEAMTWISPGDGGIWKDGKVRVDDSKINRFLAYVYDEIDPENLAEHDADEMTPNYSVYLSAQKTASWWMNTQLKAVKVKAMPRGYVATIPGVKEFEKSVNNSRSSSAANNFEDLQADHDDTPTTEIREHALFCLCVERSIGTL